MSMWSFKKKSEKLAISYENIEIDDLTDLILNFDDSELLSKEIHMIGSVDIAIFEYRVGDQKVSILVENLSGIDLVGDKDLIERISEKVKIKYNGN